MHCFLRLIQILDKKCIYNIQWCFKENYRDKVRSADISRRRKMKEHWKHEIIMSGLDLKEKHMGFKETGRIQAAGIMDANWTSFEYSKPMGRILYVCLCVCACVCVCACMCRWSHPVSDQCSTSDNFWHVQFLHYCISIGGSLFDRWKIQTVMVVIQRASWLIVHSEIILGWVGL